VTEREFIQQLAEAEVQALVEVMFLAAESDGDVGDEEIATLAETTERVTNGQVNRARAEGLLHRAKDEFERSDRETRLAAVKSALAPERRKHALLLAIQVTHSDGVIRTSERDLILQMAEALEIDGDAAADLVKIVEG
jgi:tellurite resistance protein